MVALRADFYGRCAEHPRLAAALAEHQHLLGPMRIDELRRAIEGPARAAGLRLEAGLVDAMLADVEGEPGALPLLSHALYESWARRDGRVLTRAGYRAAGGVRGAIATRPRRSSSAAVEQEQVLMRRMFLRLTELGEATEDTRRRVPLAELIPDDGGEAAAVLERLAAARLLVVGDDSAEIAHEALIREWPRLRGWLAEDREELRALRQLTTAARSWEENGRDDADLYRGPRLAAAVERTATSGSSPAVEREFLEASRDAQERELTRRAAPGASPAGAARGRRGRAGGGGDRGILRARPTRKRPAHGDRRAGRTPRRPVARGRGAAPRPGAAARAEAGRTRRLGRLARRAARGARARLADPRVAPGVRLARRRDRVQPRREAPGDDDDHGTTLWDTATWKPRRAAAAIVAGRLGGVDFSPDGRTLAIAGGKGRVELWDVATRKKLRELTDPAAATSGEPALSVVRYSPDGSVIAAGPQETNHVTLWDAASGRVIGRPIIDQAAGDGRRAVDLLQPGLEADRRPGRSRDRRDLGGRDGAPGRQAARDRERGRGGRRSSPRAAER